MNTFTSSKNFSIGAAITMLVGFILPWLNDANPLFALSGIEMNKLADLMTRANGEVGQLINAVYGIPVLSLLIILFESSKLNNKDAKSLALFKLINGLLPSLFALWLIGQYDGRAFKFMGVGLLLTLVGGIYFIFTSFSQKSGDATNEASNRPLPQFNPETAANSNHHLHGAGLLIADVSKALEAGNLEQAGKIVQKALSVDPDNLHFKSLLIKIELSKENEQDSNEWSEKAQQYFKTNNLEKAQEAVKKSIELFQTEKNLKLHSEINKKIESDTKAQKAHRLAEVHYKSGELDKAEALLLKAIELTPENKEYVTLLNAVQKDILSQHRATAQEYVKQKKYSEALNLIAICLEFDPENSDLLNFQEEIYERAKIFNTRKRKMIVAVSIATITVIIVGVCFFMQYKADKQDWLTAIKSATIQSFAVYQKKHSKGIYYIQASDSIKFYTIRDEANWKTALDQNTTEAYEFYLKTGFGYNPPYIKLTENPDTVAFKGRYLRQVLIKLDDAYWHDAADSKDTLAYRIYLNRSHYAMHGAEAEEKIKVIESATLTNWENSTFQNIVTSLLNSYTSNDFSSASDYLEPVVANFFNAENVPKTEIMRNFSIKAQDPARWERANIIWSSLEVKKTGNLASGTFNVDWYKTTDNGTSKEETYINYKFYATVDLQESKLISIYREKLSENTNEFNSPNSPENGD